ncbi:uncharacterized protein LOC131069536 isoform X2 [Cryptomeria japonica]|nr:uncharacterized protein LOC131069536 isoform X2 [Cryptomeria japonica]
MAKLDVKQDALESELTNYALGKEGASNTKERANPRVYKLVRVEGDGTFVPATEDEVEHLLEDDRDQNYVKSHKKNIISDSMSKSLDKDSPNSDSFIENEDVTGVSELEDAEAERRKLHAKLEFLEVMLQRVNEEERLRLASVVPGRSRYALNKTVSSSSNWDYSRRSPDSGSHVLSADAPSQESLSPTNSVSTDDNAILDIEKDSNESPPPEEEDNAKSDSNLSKKEICLDNLSIRELHDAFRRTFGRETSVKDKQWLKRRISTGLKSTHDGENNNFALENKTANGKKQEKVSSIGNKHITDQHVHLFENVRTPRNKVASGSSFESRGAKQPQGKDSSVHSSMEAEKIGNIFNNEFAGNGMRAGKRLQKPKAEYDEYEDTGVEQTAGKTVRKPKLEYGCYDDDLDEDITEGKRFQRPKIEYGEYDEDLRTSKTAGKRMRKPTKRYIEELSEVEPRAYNARTVPAVRDSGHGHSPLKSRVRPPYWNGTEGMPLVTRQDSFGGSGIQVPFVSRVRRGRPRKNCTSLLKYNSNGMAAKLVKKALTVRAARYEGEGADMKWKPRLPYGCVEQNIDENIQNDEKALVLVETDGHSISEPLDYDLEEDYSDGYVATVPTAKGGTRRKHHRAWTLGEVMKLVEGVSRCGAGRWSEIKRLAFSSYQHRTSVDLKDKWRNLIRASNAQFQTNKEGRTQRKHASIPIPAPILARVRELAALQSRALCAPSSSSVSRSGRTVHKKQPV